MRIFNSCTEKNAPNAKLYKIQKLNTGTYWKEPIGSKTFTNLACFDFTVHQKYNILVVPVKHKRAARDTNWYAQARTISLLP